MSASKTICFFNSATTWGGGEKWHYEMALFMKESGYDVLFIASPGSILQNKLSQKIKCIPIHVGNLSFLNPFKVLRLRTIFRTYNIDVIIINLSADLKLAGLAAKYAQVARIIYRRGSAIPIKNNTLNRFYFGKILTDVLANSEATKQTILQNNASLFPREKIKVIYNPIHTNEFLNRTSHPIYQKTGQELAIGNLGRLAPEKNHKFLIDLAVGLKSHSLPFKILIGGTGPLETDLKAYAAKNKVAADILFSGFLDNVKDLLVCCDIFVLPSLWEGFGYVMAEASLCQKPVLAFNNSSIPELVLDGITGYICPGNDVAYMTEKIQYLYAHRDIQKEMGLNGKNYVIEKFDADKINEQFFDYIEQGK